MIAHIVCKNGYGLSGDTSVLWQGTFDHFKLFTSSHGRLKWMQRKIMRNNIIVIELFEDVAFNNLTDNKIKIHITDIK